MAEKLSVKDKILSVITGSVTGLINGIFGGGGGMIVVPMLTELLKKKKKQAHATAILIILPLSIASGLVYALFSGIKWLTVGEVTLGFIAGGALGALLLRKISATWVQIVFALVMMTAGIKMLAF